MTTMTTYKAKLQLLTGYSYTYHRYRYQVLPLSILLGVMLCCVLMAALAAAWMAWAQALVAVVTLAVVGAGCVWCAWAFIEQDDAEGVDGFMAGTVVLRGVVVEGHRGGEGKREAG